jgi:hypothetical protein
MGRPKLYPNPCEGYDLSPFDDYRFDEGTHCYYKLDNVVGQIGGKTLGHLIRQHVAKSDGPFLIRTALDRLVEATLDRIRGMSV